MFFEKDKFSVLVRDYGNFVLKGGLLNGFFFFFRKLFGVVSEDVDLLFFI